MLPVKQSKFTNRFRWSLVSAALALFSIPADSVAQEFRIESQVYTEDSSLPISQNVTLFTPQLICDFLVNAEVDSSPNEIVILDTQKKSMTLLDMQREIRTEIPELQLLKLVEGLRRETQQNESVNFMVNEQFIEDTDWSDGWVTLTSPSMTYRFQGSQPKDVSILPLYFDFLDHFTRLNASDPTKIPPFPRLRLNQSIKKLGWLPSEVQISVSQNAFFRKPFNAKSKHILTMGLSLKDREMIDAAKKSWLRFPSVDLMEYRGLDRKTQRAKLKETFTNKTKLLGGSEGSAEVEDGLPTQSIPMETMEMSPDFKK